MANVPVFFEVVSNPDSEFFDSAGAAVHTNNNGEAEDVLRTRRTLQGYRSSSGRSAAGPAGFIRVAQLEHRRSCDAETPARRACAPWRSPPSC